MFTALKLRRGPGVVLAVLIISCLPASACSDELHYLPDNVRVIASIDVTAGVKAKTFKEFMKLTRAIPFGDEHAKEHEERVSKFAAKISHLIQSVGMPEMAKDDKGFATEQVEIAIAFKPISVDEAKALKIQDSFKKNVAYKEIKHGSITIYQESYQNQLGKDGKLSDVIQGDAFYVADGKYVVSSKKVAALTKIIDRNKSATLSAAMQAGLKDTGNKNIVHVVVDFQNMPAEQKADMHKTYAKFPAYADSKADIDKVQTLTVVMNEPNGKFKLSATLTCSDKANAAVVKTVSDKALDFIRAKANEEPKQPFPAELQKYLDGARTGIKAIQITSEGAKVTASLEVEPEIAMYTMMGWFFVQSSIAVSPPEKAKGSDKAPGK